VRNNWIAGQRGAGRSTPHACVEENTTWDLVNDMEKLREHLHIERWQVKSSIPTTNPIVFYFINLESSSLLILRERERDVSLVRIS
jgi:hypothetical protein